MHRLPVHHGRVFSSLAPARRRLVYAVLAVVAVAVTIASAMVVRASGSEDGSGGGSHGPVAQQRPGPVLLVPGYGGSTAALSDLARALRARGKTVELFQLPGDGRGDLTAQAKALASAATALRASQGAASIDVVGYSAGGVVARLWVRDFGGGGVARRIVTLGGPNHGSDVAAAARALLPSACPTACQQLEPGSALLTALNRGDETPSGPTFVSIWTTRDGVVVPPSSARLEGALNIAVQSICPASLVDHGGLPRDGAVQAMVVKELAAGVPVPLAHGDCPVSS